MSRSKMAATQPLSTALAVGELTVDNFGCFARVPTLVALGRPIKVVAVEASNAYQNP